MNKTVNKIVFDNTVIGIHSRELVEIKGVTELSNGLYILTGANGSGKTTLLKTIAGLLKPLRGKVFVNNFEPYKLKRRDVARIIAYTWQNPYYGFIEARVIDEIKFILKITGLKGDWSIVERLVPRTLYDRDPYTLSGGEAKRVSIASVLVADQPVWLLDEPFNELDYDGVSALLEVIGSKRKDKLIIIATHLVGLMDNLHPDKYILIKCDRSVEIDDWEQLSDDKLVEASVLPRGMICVNYCRSL